nr:uncharacterized protein LOC119173741 [Rhipicephalus microplus]
MGGASLSLEQTGALERRGLFSKFALRLDATPGDLSSPLKGDLDLERSRLSVGAAPAFCISTEVQGSVLKWSVSGCDKSQESRVDSEEPDSWPLDSSWSPSELVLLVSSPASEPAFKGAGVTDAERPGCTSLVRHRIHTGDAQPWKCNARPVSAAKRKAIDQALDELIETGVVQRSNTDASDLGLGAVLLQEHDGVLRQVAFASRSHNAAKHNYSVTERECLAIVFALRKFDCYVDGVPFVVETNHMALTWLKRLREPSDHLARWVLTLQRYNFVVCYRKGSSNVVADALSRAPVSASDTCVRHSREQSHQALSQRD